MSDLKRVPFVKLFESPTYGQIVVLMFLRPTKPDPVRVEVLATDSRGRSCGNHYYFSSRAAGRNAARRAFRSATLKTAEGEIKAVLEGR